MSSLVMVLEGQQRGNDAQEMVVRNIAPCRMVHGYSQMNVCDGPWIRRLTNGLCTYALCPSVLRVVETSLADAAKIKQLYGALISTCICRSRSL